MRLNPILLEIAKNVDKLKEFAENAEQLQGLEELKANRENQMARTAAYYVANREKELARQAAYQAANREKIAAYNAAYRAAKKAGQTSDGPDGGNAA